MTRDNLSYYFESVGRFKTKHIYFVNRTTKEMKVIFCQMIIHCQMAIH